MRSSLPEQSRRSNYLHPVQCRVILLGAVYCIALLTPIRLCGQDSPKITPVESDTRQAPSSQQPIDVQRGRRVMERFKAGEKLSAEDQAYLQRVKQAIHQRMRGQQPETARPAAEISRNDWIGLVPLTDMTALYKGEDGGLYGGGMNEPPDAHLAAHLKASKQIRPLDANGEPSEPGKIGLITIGFSNTSIESEAFKRAADADPQKSPNVVIVNGSIGGRSAVMWAWDGGCLARNRTGASRQEMDVVRMPKENRRTASGSPKIRGRHSPDASNRQAFHRCKYRRAG